MEFGKIMDAVNWADGDYILRAKKQDLKLLMYSNLKIYDDTSTSAILYHDSLWLLIKSFFSLRSHYNIAKNIRFYRRHGESWLAYIGLARFYIGYIGGFLKWKILFFCGVKKGLF